MLSAFALSKAVPVQPRLGAMPALIKARGVLIARVLAPVVGMRDRQARFLPRCDRHLERIAHEGLAHLARELPAHDPSREDVKHVDAADLGEQILVAQDTRRRRLRASGAACAR